MDFDKIYESFINGIDTALDIVSSTIGFLVGLIISPFVLIYSILKESFKI